MSGLVDASDRRAADKHDLMIRQEIEEEIERLKNEIKDL